MTDAVRIVAVILGGFALGLTVTVFVLYLHLHRMGRDGAYRVPLIGASHALLIVAIEGEIIQHVAQHEGFEWWLSPLSILAFSLSSWSLVEMVRSPQLRRRAAEVEAHIHR